VRPRDPEVAQERQAVGGLLRDARRPGGPRTLAVAAPMVGDQAMTAGQRRLREQRGEGVGDDAALNHHYRLARASLRVGQLGPIDARSMHARHGHGPPLG
jgi:hypothetical protein